MQKNKHFDIPMQINFNQTCLCKVHWNIIQLRGQRLELWHEMFVDYLTDLKRKFHQNNYIKLRQATTFEIEILSSIIV